MLFLLSKELIDMTINLIFKYCIYFEIEIRGKEPRVHKYSSSSKFVGSCQKEWMGGESACRVHFWAAFSLKILVSPTPRHILHITSFCYALLSFYHFVFFSVCLISTSFGHNLAPQRELGLTFFKAKLGQCQNCCCVLALIPLHSFSVDTQGLKSSLDRNRVDKDSTYIPKHLSQILNSSTSLTF